MEGVDSAWFQISQSVTKGGVKPDLHLRIGDALRERLMEKFSPNYLILYNVWRKKPSSVIVIHI